MAYNRFTMGQLQEQYRLEFLEKSSVFEKASPAVISDLLLERLRKQTIIALRIGSEKARSELIIMPLLLEVYEQMQEKVNLFSGVKFNVDVKHGLSGYCDYLFSLSPLHREIQAPVITVVEAKKEDINGGIPQCFAEMVAAQIFNARANKPIDTLYGIITSGEIWKFLKLQGTNATIDTDDYFLNQPEKIVGIILSMLK